MMKILQKVSHVLLQRSVEGFMWHSLFFSSTKHKDSNTRVFCLCCVNLRRAGRGLLEKLIVLQHARQIVDSLRKSSYLSNSPFRVLHLLQVVQVLLIDPNAPLEAAALWHFHVHGADVLLTIILTFLPQSAETTE